MATTRIVINNKPSTPPKTPLEIEAPNSLQKDNKISQSPKPSNPADEQISYMAAFERVKNKQYDEGIIAMNQFIAHYPNGGYTANAHYWLGELYLIKQNNVEAIGQFEAVVNQFPTSGKAAPSLLKFGYALAAAGRTDEARQKLQTVIKNYPDTHSAQLAAEKLKSL